MSSPQHLNACNIVTTYFTEVIQNMIIVLIITYFPGCSFNSWQCNKEIIMTTTVYYLLRVYFRIPVILVRCCNKQNLKNSKRYLFFFLLDPVSSCAACSPVMIVHMSPRSLDVCTSLNISSFRTVGYDGSLVSMQLSYLILLVFLGEQTLKQKAIKPVIMSNFLYNRT